MKLDFFNSKETLWNELRREADQHAHSTYSEIKRAKTKTDRFAQICRPIRVLSLNTCQKVVSKHEQYGLNDVTLLSPTSLRRHVPARYSRYTKLFLNRKPTASDRWACRILSTCYTRPSKILFYKGGRRQ